MSKPTMGRLMALEKLLQSDAVLLPQYRQLGGRGVFFAKALNRPYQFTRQDTAYAKALDFLPVTWKHAKVKEVGGRTVVWNSWIDLVAGVSNLAQRGITLTDNDDGSYTYSGTCTENYNNAITYKKSGTTPGVTAGQKWFVRLKGNPGIKFGAYGAGASNYTTAEYKIQTIVTSTSNVGIGCTYASGNTYAGTVYPLLVNLTQMFGEGNEPTDADVVNAMFPGDYYAADAGTLKSAGVTSIVSKDADAATLGTYAIPAEVQALTGYGWSAGDVYDYVDFERKVFVQAVGSVDLGAAAWGSPTEVSGGTRFAMDPTNRRGQNKNAYVINWPTVKTISSVSAAKDAETFYEYLNNAGTTRILFVSSTATTTDEVKAQLTGITYQYELSAPVETDISAYLIDDATLDVESGGTLTFENQHNGQYDIPVPSKIEYLRRLPVAEA